ncbi:MAG: sigma-70 family RNA polymerase sigma factor [Actinomycetota bacterium]
MRSDVEQAIDHLVRHDAGRVIAVVARRFGDLDLADDAVQDALIEATTRWPDDGVPDNPAAWLHQVARRKAIDALRRSTRVARRLRAAEPELAFGDGEVDAVGRGADDGRRGVDGSVVMTDGGFDPGDERLRLMLLCCHPALDADSQVALTLRLVAGLTTDEIAAAFFVPTPTIAQRITRAKRKIRTAGIPMHLPGERDDLDAEPGPGPLGDRLGFVHTVLYLVFNEGYLSRSGASGAHRVDLCAESIRLTELLARLDDGDPETLGLLAVMRFTHARRDARFADDALVLLDEQDRSTWHLDEIGAGNDVLHRALSQQRPGSFQLQALIASHHANARTASDTDWPSIVALYDQLAAMRPSPVVALNRAAAIAMADGPDAGLRALDAAAADHGDTLDRLHLTHATRGELLARSGRGGAAAAAFSRALELAANPAERTHLERRRRSVEA